MELTNISVIKDNRSDCFSIMGITNIKDYIEYIKTIYNDRGGITGQRDALKTSSAIKIRKRMIMDIVSGTVLPPIVVGLILSENEFNRIYEEFGHTASLDNTTVSSIIKEIAPENISLIDGMQRTTAIIEAIETSKNIINNTMRIELWVVKNINNLLYRMLILNTGQVPWNVRRQLEVLYSPIKKAISEAIPDIMIYSIDDGKRRSASSQYQGDDIIELFLAFGSRKEKIELKERIAEEFTRLDFIETTEKNDLMVFFIHCFKMLCALDAKLGEAKNTMTTSAEQKKTKFFNGSDLFSSQPARIGFIVALAIKVIGRPGVNRTAEIQQASLSKIEKNFNEFSEKLKPIAGDELLNFLSFDILNEIIDKPSSKVGDFERTFFKDAFTSLIEQDFQIDSFESCWRAY